MKKFLALTMIFVLSACVPAGKKSSKDAEIDGDPGVIVEPPPVPENFEHSEMLQKVEQGDYEAALDMIKNVDPNNIDFNRIPKNAVPNSKVEIAIKSYNQINATYSKLTGVKMSNEEISLNTADDQGEFIKVKNQLPVDNKRDGFSAFGQIASTRLAFTYCDLYMEQTSDFSSLSSMNNNQIATTFMNKFLDQQKLSFVEKNQIQQTLLEILGNSDLVAGSGTTAKKRSSVLACTALLSSSYITMM